MSSRGEDDDNKRQAGAVLDYASRPDKTPRGERELRNKRKREIRGRWCRSGQRTRRRKSKGHVRGR